MVHGMEPNSTDEHRRIGSQSKIAITYTCGNRRGRVDEDCECTKAIQFQYQFDAEMNVSIRTDQPGGACTTRKKATAEASLMVLVEEHIISAASNSATEINVVDNGRWGIRSFCNYEIDDQWLDNLSEMINGVLGGVTVGDFIQVFEGDQNLGDVFGGVNVGDAVTSLIELFTTPILDEEKCPGDIVNSSGPLGISGIWTGLLLDGETREYIIRVGAYNKTHGSVSFQAISETQTNYAMVVQTAPGIGIDEEPTEKNDGCCSAWTATFNGGASGDEPMDAGELWGLMGNWLTIPFPFNGCTYQGMTQLWSRGDAGSCESFEYVSEECDLDIIHILGRNGNSSTNNTQTSRLIMNPILFNANGQHFNIEISDEVNQVRLLHDAVRNTLSRKNLSSGIYFIQYKRGSTLETEKIFYNK